jgi:hypothetical protein
MFTNFKATALTCRMLCFVVSPLISLESQGSRAHGMGYTDLLFNLDRHIVLFGRTIGWMYKTPFLKNQHLIRKNLRVRAKQSKTRRRVEFPFRTTPRTRAAHEGVRSRPLGMNQTHLSHARPRKLCLRLLYKSPPLRRRTHDHHP